MFFKKRHQQFGEVKTKKEKSGTGKELIAKLSRGLMLPIAMLPIAGLFLGLGSTIVNLAGEHNGGLKIFGQIFQVPGNMLFSCLPVLFAIAIAIAFTHDSGTAGLSALVGWIVFNAIQMAFIVNPTVPSTPPSHDITGKYHFLWYSYDATYTIADKQWSSTMFSAIFTSNIGITSLNTSAFGGIFVGALVAFLYNRFKNIQLPTVIGFFSGVRFIPIITFICCLILGILFSMIWPLIGLGLFYFGKYIGYAPYGFNSFVFGFVERSLVPFGLHHAFYAPLWYTPAGGCINVGFNTPIYWDGVATGATWGSIGIDSSIWKNSTSLSINGDQSLWMFVNNSLCGKTVGTHTITLSNYHHLFNGLPNLPSDDINYPGLISGNPGQYMQGKYPFMMFGLPAAAMAMIFCVPKLGDGRKQAFSIIGASALTSLLTGITEPLEFTFLFLAPWLFWGIHAPLAGISFWLMNILGAHMGMTFSGGLLDFIVYGVLPDVTKHGANCYWTIAIGMCLIPLYFFLFKTLILHFDIKTPGRDRSIKIKMFTKVDYKAQQSAEHEDVQPRDSDVPKDKYTLIAEQAIIAYGGKDNIKNVDACITKLRVQIVDQSKVNKDMLIGLGARGVIKPSPQSVYAVFGNEADIIKNRMNDILKIGGLQ